MTTTSHDRTVVVGPAGKPVCLDGAVVKVPADFLFVLMALSADLQLALDCIEMFGGIPIPVAKAILRNIEPAHAAIDIAIKAKPQAKKKGI